MSIDIELERLQFEEAYVAAAMPVKADWFRLHSDGEYEYSPTADAWRGWLLKARATPQAPTPAAAELAETYLQAKLKGDGWVEVNARQHATYASAGTPVRTLYCYTSPVAAPLPRQAAVQGDWISVADRLPKYSKKPDSLGVEVIVYPVPEKGESTAFFGCRITSTPSFYKYGSRIEGVTHWIPIPAAPQTAPDQAKSAPATTGKEKS